MQVIREDYDSVLARTEDIERSENDLGAKHEHRREVEEKMSALKDEQQQNSDQVGALTVHALTPEVCEGVCDALSHALSSTRDSKAAIGVACTRPSADSSFALI